MHTKTEKPRHFISTRGFAKAEIMLMAEIGAKIRRSIKLDNYPHLLRDKTLALLMENGAGTAYETAMAQLGGHAQYIDTAGLESMNAERMAEKLSKLHDAAAVGAGGGKLLQELAAYADIPLIGQSDEDPVQAVCEAVKAYEAEGEAESFEDERLTAIRGILVFLLKEEMSQRVKDAAMKASLNETLARLY